MRKEDWFFGPDTNDGQFSIVLVFVFILLIVNRRVMIDSRFEPAVVKERLHAHEVNVPVVGW